MTQPSRKDELLTQIVELETKITRDKSKVAEEEETLSEVNEKKKVVEKAYEEIKRQFEEVSRLYNESHYNIRDLGRVIQHNESELSTYKRELSRLLDAEKINQAYMEQLEAFREKCLEAYWRPENREDERGAMQHQIEGAIQLAVAGQALLGDKRGLGKTLTSLIYADFVEAKKIVVVCPPDLMDNYIREIKLWAPHRGPIKLGGMSKGVRDFLLPNLRTAAQFVLVLNYEAWRRDPDLIKDIVSLQADTVIFDEAHRAKTWNTHTCKGVMDIRFGTNICPNCDDPQVFTFDMNPNRARCTNCRHEGFVLDFCSVKNVLPMTGTPILNRPQELFPQLRLIDPKNFIRVQDFLSDFCAQQGNNHWTWRWGAESELMKKIGPRYLARDRKSAGVIIPPAQMVEHIITLDEIKESHPLQYKAYEQTRDYAQLVLDPDKDIAMSMTDFIVVMLRLRQVITWPAAIELKKYNEETDMTEVIAKLDVHQSAKLDKAEELIREINDEGERVVLFSQFRGPLEELQRRLGARTAVYQGGMTDYAKNRIQLDFDPKTVGDNPIYDNVLVNYKAGGEGLNLNAATQMIILDEEWNPGRQEQAYGRIDRLGQTRDTTIHTIRVEGSVDSWMHSLIEEKRNMIGGFENQASMYRAAYDALRKGQM